ncbi:hypothetical protein [Hufsiella ginkgonis]|uniref:Beta-lactamase-inhibitor-like PepSY-like domain-containing protein n=1 Tax=Hufsiella ginkgonis TaxID=2695274 RepID=A0A7K1XYX8_9SPHI|nr:hypothetical protein [Hufsiella ginkgonis]MXV16205.1 hypothetical protein [Hufsiella ginkgonis]
MKKLLIATLFLAMTASTYAATDVKADDDSKSISYTVLNQFAAEFSDATNVVWTLTTQFQKASFVSNGDKISAYYSPLGDYLGATKFVSIDVVPAKAKAEIAKKYEGYTVSYAIQVISRPYVANATDDTGSYWVDITDGKKELYLKVTPFGGIELIKESAVK